MDVAAIVVASAIAAVALGALLWLISRSTVLPDTGRTSAPPGRSNTSTRSTLLFAALTLQEKRAALDISPVVYQAEIEARLGNVEMTTTGGWSHRVIEKMTDDDLRAGVRLGILARRAVAEHSSIESIKIFEAILETAPFDSISAMSIGTRYHMIGDRRRALEYMQTALRMDPTNSRIRTNIHRLTQDGS